jgi:hypothetical protein
MADQGRTKEKKCEATRKEEIKQKNVQIYSRKDKESFLFLYLISGVQ